MILTPTQWAMFASIASVASGVVTIVALIWRGWAGRVLKATLRALAWLDPLRGLKIEVAHIAKELRPNGGTSISDKVNAIWTRQGMTETSTAMLLDESPALLWRSDLEGRMVWASRALVEATGRPLNELLGWGWLNVIHPDDRERVRKAWISCLVEQRTFEDGCRLQNLRGEQYIGKLVARPFNFDGRVIAWNGRATLEPPKTHRETATLRQVLPP